MIIETKVPEDVRKYKTKLIGPFTARQFICTSVAAGIDIPVGLLMYGAGVNLQNLIYVIIIIDVPVMLFAFDVHGIPMRKYLFGILLPGFFAPVKRKNVTMIRKRDEPDPPSSKEEAQRLKKERKAGYRSYA